MLGTFDDKETWGGGLIQWGQSYKTTTTVNYKSRVVLYLGKNFALSIMLLGSSTY